MKKMLFKSARNTDKRIFTRDALELPAGETLKITAEVGNVRIVRGTEATVLAVLEQFSSEPNPTSRFKLESPAETELRLTAARVPNGTDARLTVSLPKSLSELTVDVQTGNVEISDITADMLRVKISTGNLKAERTTVKDADLQVDTGNAKICGSVQVSNTMQIICNSGNVDFSMPMDGASLIEYTVDTGNTVLENDVQKAWKHAGTRKGTSQTGTLTYLHTTDAVSGNYKLHIALGNIKFLTETN